MNNFHRMLISEFLAIFDFVFANLIEKATHVFFLEFVAKSGQKFIKNSQKNTKFDAENEKSEIQYSFAKKCWRFLAEILRLKSGARSGLCRSRRELSNEYLLAKIGVDTADNEPLEVRGKIIQYYSFVSLMDTPPWVAEPCRQNSAEKEVEKSFAASRGGSGFP